jgi:hypothetical protein
MDQHVFQLLSLYGVKTDKRLPVPPPVLAKSTRKVGELHETSRWKALIFLTVLLSDMPDIAGYHFIQEKYIKRIPNQNFRGGTLIDPSILAGFLPWIAFAIASSFLGLKAGALIGLALQIVLFIPVVLKRNYTALEAFGMIFFILLTAASLVLGEKDLQSIAQWSGALTYGSLAAVAWGTIALGDPFTRQYGRRTVPKEWWTTPLFLSSTSSIALGWSIAFSGATAVSILGALRGMNWRILQALGLGFMLLAILWHARVMKATQEEAKRLLEMKEGAGPGNSG